MAIRAYLNGGAFKPEDIEAMSLAVEDVCKVLQIKPAAAREREVIAVRIVELARRGERSPTRLVEMVLRDAGVFGRNDRRSA
jgi:hypothetical protein